jgi:CMP/dCMP kinase
VTDQPTPFVIALDGPAASGKSTVGLGAARRLGFGYFDTGLLYRALTWLALAQEADTTDADGLTRLVADLRVEVDPKGRVSRDGVDITNQLQAPAVDRAVSIVSAPATVRAALRPVQRSLIRPPGLVMAGRDIGTIIAPDAPLKIWLSASVEERARRRSAQTGEAFESVLGAMRRRDQLDASRDVAPMARAADAVVLDTDGLTPEDVIARIVAQAVQRGVQPVQ